MNPFLKRFSFLSPIQIFILLFLAGLIIFSGTFNNEFCSDDLKIIVENSVIKQPGNWTGLWQAFNTRFLTGITFALNYRLDKLNVSGYHLVNIFIHILASFLVYCFVLLTCRTPGMKTSPLVEQSRCLAGFSALIFLLHPIQTQAVNFITQRATALGAVFYLLVLVLYVKARLDKNNWCYLGAGIAMIMGIFTKEMLITLPGMLTVYELYFLKQKHEAKRSLLASLGPFYVLACIVPLTLLMDRDGSLLGLRAQISGRPFNWIYCLTEINVLRTYMRMMFVPLHQSHNYSYPLATGLLDWTVLFSLFWLLLMVVFAVRQYKPARLLSFCVIWFFIAVAVETLHVCFVNKGILYDHWLYLAMVGYAVFIPAALYTFVKNGKTVTTALVVLVIVLGLLSYQRNKVWRTCTSLWQDVVNKYPLDYLPYVNLGVAYSRQGLSDKAIDIFDRALSLYNGSDSKVPAQILINIGAAFGRKGDYVKEIELNQQAVRWDPYNAQAYSNLCLAYTLLGNGQEALTWGNKAVEINPLYADGYNNLGVLFGQQGQIDKALQYFQTALKINPDDITAQRNLNLALEKLNAHE